MTSERFYILLMLCPTGQQECEGLKSPSGPIDIVIGDNKTFGKDDQGRVFVLPPAQNTEE